MEELSLEKLRPKSPEKRDAREILAAWAEANFPEHAAEVQKTYFRVAGDTIHVKEGFSFQGFSLPEGKVVFDGDCDVRYSELRKLPEGIRVKGTVYDAGNPAAVMADFDHLKSLKRIGGEVIHTNE
jgi:hypothetical protein